MRIWDLGVNTPLLTPKSQILPPSFTKPLTYSRSAVLVFSTGGASCTNIFCGSECSFISRYT